MLTHNMKKKEELRDRRDLQVTNMPADHPHSATPINSIKSLDENRQTVFLAAGHSENASSKVVVILKLFSLLLLLGLPQDLCTSWLQ